MRPRPLTDHAYATGDTAGMDKPVDLSGQTQSPDGDGADLLTMPEPQCAEALMRLGKAHRKMPAASLRHARWEVNRLRREGLTGLRVQKLENRDGYKAYVPFGGAGFNLDYYNKARVLGRTHLGILFADPPAALVEPVDGGEVDRDAQEVTQRALDDLQGPTRLNTVRKLRQAKDRGFTYGSGFIVYTLDPTAGGREPRTIQASPLATEAAHPLMDPTTGQPHAPPADPMADPLAPPPTAPDPIERYLHQDGASITDDKTQALHEWKPGLTSRVLDSRHVLPIPHTAPIAEAHGVIVDDFLPWGVVKTMFPDLAKLPDADTDTIKAYRPEWCGQVWPREHKANVQDGDEAEVFVRAVVYTECPAYEDGFYGFVVGGTRVPWRGKHVVDRPAAGGKPAKRIALPLPASQVKGSDNGTADPYGGAEMDDLGGPTELMAAMVGYMIAYLDRWVNMPVFVPHTSDLKSSDLMKPFVRILPGQQPYAVRGPGLDAAVPQMYETSEQQANAAAHLNETAQAMQTPSVTSGRQAFQIVAQAQAQLSEPRQNIIEGYLQACRIELAYAQAYDLGGEARWSGADGEYKLRRWRGADLTGDVRLKPGTMSLMSPAMKIQMVSDWQAMGMLSPDAAKELLAHNTSPMLGQLDDPFTLEVRRSIDQWEQGPPEGYQGPPPPMPQTVPGAPDPMTGQPTAPVTQLVPQPDPVAQAVFPPTVHHTLPNVAQVRVTELAKAMAGRAFQQQDPIWQAVMAAEFQRCAALAAPPAPVQPAAPGKPGQSASQPNGGDFGSAQPSTPMDNPQARAA